MKRWAKRAVSVLLPVIAILLFWTSQAAWGRRADDGTRYKFDLTGVARITNFGSKAEARDHCNWYESAANRRHCTPAAAEAKAYRLLQLAPAAAAIAVLSFVALAWLSARDYRVVLRERTLPLISIAGSVSMLVAIVLLTRNVGRAVAVYAGHALDMRGSGLTTAWIVVMLFAAAAVLTVPFHSSSGTR